MADMLDTLLSFKIPYTDFPVVYVIGVIFLGVILILWLKKRNTKPEGLKRTSIYKTIRENTEKLFAISEDDFGLGRNLKLGYRDLGVVMGAVLFNWYEDISKTDIEQPEFQKQIEENLSDKNVIENLRKLITQDENKPKKERITIPFYVFKVCDSGFFARILARFDIGVRYYYVEKSLVTPSTFDIIIKTDLTPMPYLDVVIFTETGRAVVTDMAFKIALENVLEELVNYMPKQTWLETKQAEGKLQLDLLTESNKKRKEENLEKMNKV